MQYIPYPKKRRVGSDVSTAPLVLSPVIHVSSKTIRLVMQWKSYAGDAKISYFSRFKAKSLENHQFLLVIRLDMRKWLFPRSQITSQLIQGHVKTLSWESILHWRRSYGESLLRWVHNLFPQLKKTHDKVQYEQKLSVLFFGFFTV